MAQEFFLGDLVLVWIVGCFVVMAPNVGLSLLVSYQNTVMAQDFDQNKLKLNFTWIISNSQAISLCFLEVGILTHTPFSCYSLKKKCVDVTSRIIGVRSNSTSKAISRGENCPSLKRTTLDIF